MALPNDSRWRMTVDLGRGLALALRAMRDSGVMKEHYSRYERFTDSLMIRMAVYELAVRMLGKAAVEEMVDRPPVFVMGGDWALGWPPGVTDRSAAIRREIWAAYRNGPPPEVPKCLPGADGDDGDDDGRIRVRV